MTRKSFARPLPTNRRNGEAVSATRERTSDSGVL